LPLRRIYAFQTGFYFFFGKKPYVLICNVLGYLERRGGVQFVLMDTLRGIRNPPGIRRGFGHMITACQKGFYIVKLNCPRLRNIFLRMFNIVLIFDVPKNA
jgi:hypothetical protein